MQLGSLYRRWDLLWVPYSIDEEDAAAEPATSLQRFFHADGHSRELDLV